MSKAREILEAATKTEMIAFKRDMSIEYDDYQTTEVTGVMVDGMNVELMAIGLDREMGCYSLVIDSVSGGKQWVVTNLQSMGDALEIAHKIDSMGRISIPVLQKLAQMAGGKVI